MKILLPLLAGLLSAIAAKVVKAMQEQQGEIAELQAQIKQLKAH